jgi:hypothetical protein
MKHNEIAKMSAVHGTVNAALVKAAAFIFSTLQKAPFLMISPGKVRFQKSIKYKIRFCSNY